MWCAGVVKLDSGDRLELLIPRTQANISLDGDSTFLGAIKLAWQWKKALDQTLNEIGYAIIIIHHWTSWIQELLYAVEYSWKCFHWTALYPGSLHFSGISSDMHKIDFIHHIEVPLCRNSWFISLHNVLSKYSNVSEMTSLFKALIVFHIFNCLTHSGVLPFFTIQSVPDELSSPTQHFYLSNCY